MALLPIVEPARIGWVPDRLERAYALLERWTRAGQVPAAALCVGRREGIVAPRVFGRQRPDGDAPLQPDALFLVASITKPVTVTAVMMLVERGELALEDRVTEYVPPFGQNGKADVQIRHLMTHTSGLPDMLPNNAALRAAHAPWRRSSKRSASCPAAVPAGNASELPEHGHGHAGRDRPPGHRRHAGRVPPPRGLRTAGDE